jgi:hypothetical protein
MILSTSIALDDDSDTLDSLFINEVDDDDNDDYIFKDVVFFSNSATPFNTCYCYNYKGLILSTLVIQLACRSKALLIRHVSCRL